MSVWGVIKGGMNLPISGAPAPTVGRIRSAAQRRGGDVLRPVGRDSPPGRLSYWPSRLASEEYPGGQRDGGRPPALDSPEPRGAPGTAYSSGGCSSRPFFLSAPSLSLPTGTSGVPHSQVRACRAPVADHWATGRRKRTRSRLPVQPAAAHNQKASDLRAQRTLVCRGHVPRIQAAARHG